MNKIEEERNACLRELPEAERRMLTMQRDKALDLVLEITEDDPSFICEALHSIEQEATICEKNCTEFSRGCLLRFLRYYERGCLTKVEEEI